MRRGLELLEDRTLPAISLTSLTNPAVFGQAVTFTGTAALPATTFASTMSPTGQRCWPQALPTAAAEVITNSPFGSAPSTGDYPEWLDPHLARVFGDERAEEGAALARARRSICASTRSRPSATRRCRRSPISRRSRRAGRRMGLRIGLAADAKSPAVHAEPAFIKGLVEVQDEGSQLAALLAGAKPGEQVLDLCAGGGGKTLALAAAMENKGQLYATDDDKRRLAPIHDAAERAGARNVQVRTPKVGRAPSSPISRAAWTSC